MHKLLNESPHLFHHQSSARGRILANMPVLDLHLGHLGPQSKQADPSLYLTIWSIKKPGSILSHLADGYHWQARVQYSGPRHGLHFISKNKQIMIWMTQAQLKLYHFTSPPLRRPNQFTLLEINPHGKLYISMPQNCAFQGRIPCSSNQDS